MENNDKSLLYVGYKCKAKVNSNYPCYITALYITTEEQEDFIKWWHAEIKPLLDKKFKSKNRSNKNDKI